MIQFLTLENNTSSYISFFKEKNEREKYLIMYSSNGIQKFSLEDMEIHSSASFLGYVMYASSPTFLIELSKDFLMPAELMLKKTTLLNRTVFVFNRKETVEQFVMFLVSNDYDF